MSNFTDDLLWYNLQDDQEVIYILQSWLTEIVLTYGTSLF